MSQAMEENSDAHMETDVSSTTDDMLETPQVTGSHGDMEMVVVVEEVKEEDSSSIDLDSKTTTPSTSTNTSPQKQTTPQKVIKPFIENDISKKLSNNVSESQKSKISQSSVKISPVKQQPEFSDLFKKAEITVSPGKNKEKNVDKISIKIVDRTVEKSPIKITQIQNVKSPFKDVKLVAKSPIKLTRIQEKPLNNDVSSLQKSPPKDFQENSNKEASLVKTCNTEIKLLEQSTKTVTAENLNNQKIVTDNSLNKLSNLKEISVKEIKVIEKSPVKESQTTPSMNVELTKNTSIETSSKIQPTSEEKTVQDSAAKVPVNEGSVPDNTSSNIGKTPDLINNITEKTKTVNGGDKMDTSLPPDESFTEQNNSQHSETESHNKSISRELKSLIKSAKESKIISECNQLKSKTRKSRTQLDTSNASLNLEADKILNRRYSNNSQVSNSSEQSDKNLKRSMRSQNPEFANKCKQFLNSVTSKVMKDFDDALSDEESTADKSDTGPKHDSEPTSPKKKKVSDQPVSMSIITFLKSFNISYAIQDGRRPRTELSKIINNVLNC